MEHTDTRFSLNEYGCTLEDQIAEMALNLEEVLIHALLGLCVFVGLLFGGVCARVCVGGEGGGEGGEVHCDF